MSSTVMEVPGRDEAYPVRDRVVVFLYENWRGETGWRYAIPTGLVFKATQHHPEPQWIMTAFDLDRMLGRDFALRGIKKVAFRGNSAAMESNVTELVNKYKKYLDTGISYKHNYKQEFAKMIADRVQNVGGNYVVITSHIADQS